MDIVIAIVVTALVSFAAAFLLFRRPAEPRVVYLTDAVPDHHTAEHTKRIAPRFKVMVGDEVVFATDDPVEAQERRRAERQAGRGAVVMPPT